MTDQSSPSYTIADYLFDRIAETGATEVFGVPGDFNLPFLDNILAHDTLRWVGNNNELNAGYCADGYARVRGFAAMVTTFGVGELSAINATAGSYAEYAPVLHIVGAPAVATQQSGRRVHHTLGDGKFGHFFQMARRVNCAQAWLTPANAAYEIDRVISEILTHRRPGYLVLSPDVARAPIYRPDGPLETPALGGTSSAALEAFKAAAAEFVRGKKTTVLADLLVHRLDAWDQFRDFIDATDVPYATLAWGKSLVNEESPRFAGIYAGSASGERVRAAVEDAECLITLGVEYTDNTTAGFSMEIDPEATLEVSARTASVGGRPFAPVTLRDAIVALTEVAREEALLPQDLAASGPREDSDIDWERPLDQDDLWDVVSSWLPAQSIIVGEQGTSFFGLADRNIPTDAMFIGQPLWGSIGYTLPAALGAGIADRSRRPILLIGDGSAQLTVQEISTMIRERVNTIILLINNSGYTVERAIHGPEQLYNDIAPYNWQAIPTAFGGTEETVLSLEARTARELKEGLETAAAETDKLVLLEVFTEKQAVPKLLGDIAAALGRNTKI